jgi:putative ABC transport system permease protein
VASWLRGLEGRLASDNLVRSPGRTGLVITVLAAGVMIFLQTAGVIRSNTDPFLEWTDQTFDADLFVSSGNALTGSGQNLLLKKDLGSEIVRHCPEVEAALPVRTRQVDFGDNMVFLIALDAQGFEDTLKATGPVHGRHLYARLHQAGPARVVVSENFAALHRVKEDDVISLRGPHGPIQLQVAGVTVDYNFPRGTVIMDRELYQQHFDDPLVDQFYVYLRPDADPDAVRSRILQRWEAEHALVIWKREQVRNHLLQVIQRFSLVAYSQEVVVGLVAGLGVVFALLISVMQRRRELGILRAVGATQGQVLLSVLAEAILMGVIGTLIGLLVGMAVEWYCVRVILFEEAGFYFPVLIPWQEAGLIAVVAVSIATLAGLFPAMRTLHLRIPEAIAYE